MDTVATSRRKKRSFSVGWKTQPHPAPPSQMAPKVSQGASWVKQAYSRKIEPAENPMQVTALRSWLGERAIITIAMPNSTALPMMGARMGT